MVDIRQSKSKIMDYVTCPRMFYFRYCTTMGKCNRQSSPELERGSILHEIYEAYNTNPEKYEQYTEFVKKVSDHEHYEKNLAGFFSLLNKYGFDKADYSELEIMDDEMNLKGIIDAIYVHRMEGECSEAEFVLIDYKTGKYHANKKNDYMMELYIYEHIANNWFNKRNGAKDVKYIDRVGMFFTADPDSSFIVPVSDDTVKVGRKKYAGRKECMSRAYQIMDDIKNDKFDGVGKMCRWCQFASACDDYSDNHVEKLDNHVLMVV